ncbi:MAG TPA: cyclic nucleotide-binding domain-containing protein [Mycobacteriales bacterium]|nr:cyclic nucleotide-binding domain-containing protein [Mycobacteriales bacterium]
MTTTRDLPELLRRVDLFADLGDRDRKAIAKQMKIVDVAGGHQVTEEGGGAVGFHLILEGTADVAVKGAHRNSLGPGEYFGEISLIDGLPRSATVTATTPMKTASIAAWDFMPIVHDSPELVATLLKGLCARIRAAEAASD